MPRHLDEALAWLKRAQDAGADHGVSYGVSFGEDFDLSYPETTGYICQTFVRQGLARRDQNLLDRAVAMADWEIDIQLDSGAVMGGKVNPHPSPAVFNTGMVLLGWSAVIRLLHEKRHMQAAARASEWLTQGQDPDGRWRQGNSKFAAADSTLYNVMAAWGLCEAGVELGEDRFVEAAVRNGEYCLSQQHPNGWLPDCCLTDPTSPLLHTLAYSMQGLLGIGRLTGRQDLMEGARRLADRCQPFRTDVLFAMQAYAEGSFVDAPKRGPHVAEQLRFAVQIADREFALRGVLHFVQGVRALLDGNSLAISHERDQLCLLRLQNIFKFV